MDEAFVTLGGVVTPVVVVLVKPTLVVTAVSAQEHIMCKVFKIQIETTQSALTIMV